MKLSKYRSQLFRRPLARKMAAAFHANINTSDKNKQQTVVLTIYVLWEENLSKLDLARRL